VKISSTKDTKCKIYVYLQVHPNMLTPSPGKKCVLVCVYPSGVVYIHVCFYACQTAIRLAEVPEAAQGHYRHETGHLNHDAALSEQPYE
jgi:hypothetical protein